jgi:putative SOS response-associated peptidase YedK
MTALVGYCALAAVLDPLTFPVMCGRYELHTHPAALALALGLKYAPEIQARYNIAPTQQVPIVRLNMVGERELSQVRWGLVPFWAKDIAIGNKMINARAESIATKSGYRDAYKNARCLIPASGFYEWAKMTDGTKQPVYIGIKDDAPSHSLACGRGGDRRAARNWRHAAS